MLTAAALALLLSAAGWAAKKPKETVIQEAPLDLLMDGGRKLSFERSFSLEREVKPKRGFWTRVVDVVAGEPDFHYLVNPYSIAVDSRGRIIVTDPGADGVHIFDFTEQKYKFLTRKGKDKEPMLLPQCVAVDTHDNIYVTDSEAGKIFVFDPGGKFQRAIGSLKGGEGMFKRPTGIAVDSAAQHIYVTDTLRDKIFMLDMRGSVLQVIGKLGDGVGMIFRPKGIGFDSEGHLYVVDGLWGVVQVFDEQGRLLYYFGQKGTGLGEFQLPSGLQIDNGDRIYVVDSFNRRVQIFHYYGLNRQTSGIKQ